jgi:hypothetical protein
MEDELAVALQRIHVDLRGSWIMSA